MQSLALNVGDSKQKPVLDSPRMHQTPENTRNSYVKPDFQVEPKNGTNFYYINTKTAVSQNV
ncbi:hypothetical protein J2Y03_005611 [Neobacillus niacini]|jgi:hypothetical protein|uniref:hypothetical protein n=1 Tax=Neobacillus niacini TaxID=86668 RepID=UPI00285D4ECB|nr:hypothetical protein [Neobacillus niacini]MDR7080524.1 hypothetical protein [Neobacillus niacini]